MKKVIAIVVIILLGVGAYFGYYGFQRFGIDYILEADLNMYLPHPEKVDDPAQKQLLEQEKIFRIDEYKRAAATSKTIGEYQQKSLAILEASIQRSKQYYENK